MANDTMLIRIKRPPKGYRLYRVLARSNDEPWFFHECEIIGVVTGNRKKDTADMKRRAKVTRQRHAEEAAALNRALDEKAAAQARGQAGE